MARADDLAGLDLEVRHRVGTRVVGEQQVAVELEGVGALGFRTDQHVADPDRMRLTTAVAGRISLQRTLVHHVGAAVRLVVVDEESLFEMLSGIGEVQTPEFDVAARRRVADQR